ncbi:conserved hypothetical protein [Ricinus communis]|uniref:Uncharacterized protein n=1 Tax=Ricinus communis TaxID=3988 RepID=B9TF65_RICCO|nr:conserved hypothetical protein [Ricinus communis]
MSRIDILNLDVVQQTRPVVAAAPRTLQLEKSKWLAAAGETEAEIPPEVEHDVRREMAHIKIAGRATRSHERMRRVFMNPAHRSPPIVATPLPYRCERTRAIDSAVVSQCAGVTSDRYRCKDSSTVRPTQPYGVRTHSHHPADASGQPISVRIAMRARRLASYRRADVWCDTGRRARQARSMRRNRPGQAVAVEGIDLCLPGSSDIGSAALVAALPHLGDVERL